MSYGSFRGFIDGAIGVITLGAVKLDRPEQTSNKPLNSKYVNRYKKYWRPNPTALDAYNGKEDREQHCHRVQEKIYWVAYIIISGATLGTAIAAARFAWLAYQAADSQAATARKTFIESDRPIFDVTFIDDNALGEHNSSKPKIKIAVTNIGNKPGYVRYVSVKISVSNEVIGACSDILGSRIVPSAQGLQIPCSTNTLTISQHENVIAMIVKGKVDYRSLTNFCWEKKFNYFWVNKNEYLPAHMVLDAAEETNAETAVGCDNPIVLGAD